MLASINHTLPFSNPWTKRNWLLGKRSLILERFLWNDQVGLLSRKTLLWVNLSSKYSEYNSHKTRWYRTLNNDCHAGSSHDKTKQTPVFYFVEILVGKLYYTSLHRYNFSLQLSSEYFDNILGKTLSLKRDECKRYFCFFQFFFSWKSARF